jgi:hypothetical protein
VHLVFGFGLVDRDSSENTSDLRVLKAKRDRGGRWSGESAVAPCVDRKVLTQKGTYLKKVVLKHQTW